MNPIFVSVIRQFSLRWACLAAVAGVISVGCVRSFAADIALGELDLTKMRQDAGSPKIDRSFDNKPISVGGRQFDHGVGTHAASTLFIRLDGHATRFTAQVGVDDELSKSSQAQAYPLEFRVLCDGRTAFESKAMKVGVAKPVDIDLAGVRTLILTVQPVGPGNYSMHADWAAATISYTGEKPIATGIPIEPPDILTPAPQETPRINGAKIVGVRPGRPLLYQVAATGRRPMAFGADGLPEGFSIDPQTGCITGNSEKAGTYRIQLSAKNDLGQATRELRIEVGDTIALTPPMGWNSWNCFAHSVSAEKVEQAVDAMVSSGLQQHGWTYVNIDDCWQIRSNQPADQRRTADGQIVANDRFPDMKALTDYVHAHGLKAGLYSSPGRGTCAGYEGSLNFEAKDARQYADWGFDYLKYDWCSYGRTANEIRARANHPPEIEILQHPYALMHDELSQQSRDIVYSLCQYGMGNVWTWGKKIGANCWRTTDDINDSWSSMSGIGFNESAHAQFAGPGHWNDPDMMVIGKVGWGPKLRATRLTPNEQYTHVTLWSMLAAPMLIGCDLTQLDDFTRGLLTNDEVIAVNQDPLGKAARQVVVDGAIEIWSRPLEDGSMAVGLFNRDEVSRTIKVKWVQLGLIGGQEVRDLWRQKSLGSSADGFSAEVGRHGVVLIKLTSQAKTTP